MEATYYSEMLVDFERSMQCNITEDATEDKKY
jgi:hypothetical protein